MITNAFDLLMTQPITLDVTLPRLQAGGFEVQMFAIYITGAMQKTTGSHISCKSIDLFHRKCAGCTLG